MTDPRTTFDLLVREHEDALFGAALRMSRNRSDAQDLLQETYLRAYRSFGRFREGSSFPAWAHTILRNAHLTGVRRMQREQGSSFLEDMERPGTEIEDVGLATARVSGPRRPDVSTASSASGVGRTRGRETDLVALRKAISGLGEEDRRILHLAYMEGFTCREIARVMDCPVGTVLSRLSRVRGRLRSELEAYSPDLSSRSHGCTGRSGACSPAPSSFQVKKRYQAMKTHILSGLVILGILLAGGARPALSEPSLIVTVPFSFVAAGAPFPAGRYSLALMDQGLLRIRSADGSPAAITQTVPCGLAGTSPTSRPQMIFKKYGDHFVLAQVFPAGNATGRALIPHALERDLARRDSGPDGRLAKKRP